MTSVRDLGLLVRSLSYTRPSQLAARVRLRGKRALLARIGPTVPGLREGLARDAPPLHPDLPRPPLPLRNKFVVAGYGGRLITLPGAHHPLRLPVEWDPPALENGTRLAKLHLHYMEWLEELDDADVAAVLRDWVLRVPPYRQSYWLDSWNAYALSIRTVVWMQQMATRGSCLDACTRELVHRSLWRQLRFLARNLEVDIGGNHLIKNLKALLWAGRFFVGIDARRWRERAGSLLKREFAEQVLADGMHFERSPAYHTQVFVDLLECYAVLEEGPLRDWLESRLDAMAQVLDDLTHSDGLPSPFNDGGLHMAYAPAEVQKVCARTRGSVPAPQRVFALEEAGYFGLRDGHSLFVADCGRVSPDHLPAHGDVFAFEWSVAGQRMMVDSGVFEYNPGRWRTLSRSTRAHNTLTLDGLDQCEFWGAFRVARRPRVSEVPIETLGDDTVLEGCPDGYAHLPGRPRHGRRFEVTPGCVAVQNTVEGACGQRAQARLLLHPECELTTEERGFSFSRRGTTLRLRSE